MQTCYFMLYARLGYHLYIHSFGIAPFLYNLLSEAFLYYQPKYNTCKLADYGGLLVFAKSIYAFVFYKSRIINNNNRSF